MTEEERYQAAWRDRNRRSLIAIGLAVGGSLALIVPVFFTTVPQREHLASTWLVLFGALLLSGFASVFYAGRFRCPRCDNRFSSNRKSRWIPQYCTHCGLPVGSGPTDAVDPLFKKSN
jgi:hypothetical protein